MTPSNNKITVKVDYSQKSSINVAGGSLLLAKEFNNNRRESMPVLCEVVDGNEHTPSGTFLLVHHNRFVENSPHHLEDNLYSLAWNDSIFARVEGDGRAVGLCDNVLVEYVYENDNPLIPEHLRKVNKHKYKVLDSKFGFKKGQYVFAYDFANYEIIYVWKGVEHRVVKIKKSDIVGKKIE